MAADDQATLIRVAADRLVTATFRQRAALAAALGLQRTDLVALDHIGHREGVTPTELARVLFLSSGGTTAVVDRLGAAGLVERTRGVAHRRRVILGVTPRGRATVEAYQAPLVEDVARLTGELTPEQRELVEGFLGRLADVAERHADRLMPEASAAAASASGVPSPVLWG